MIAYRTLLLLLLAALLGGCAGKIRYPDYYVLNLRPPQAVTASKPALGSVAVRQFAAAEYLRSGQIVYRPRAEQIGFYDYHCWGVDPRAAITAALIREVQGRSLFRSVNLMDSPGNPDYLLTGSLERFEELDGDGGVSVEVRVAARLVDTRSGEVVWHDELQKSETPGERSVPGIVAALSRSVDDVVSRLGASLEARVTPLAAAQ